MSYVIIGPTGNVVKGGVLDCATKPLLRALRDYDPQLYLQWNPRKREGMGVWEVRRRPDKKSVYRVYEWEGNTYLHIDYVEYPLVNHILDCKDGLNYNIITKLKAMDTWKDPNWVSNLVYSEAKEVVRLEDAAISELKYGLKQYGRAAKDLKEFVLSGTPLTDLAKHWGRK